MTKVAIFASGTGSNADRILDFLTEKQSDLQIACFLTNKKEAGIYQVAKKHQVPIHYFSNEEFKVSTPVLTFLQQQNIEWIVLAGFLRKIESPLIQTFENKIFNLHPSLLPKYGGKGMYGSKVHKAVIEAGEKESGISIHLVNNEFDKGEILFQAKCELESGQTVEELSEKIQKLEHEFFAKTIADYVSSELL